MHHHEDISGQTVNRDPYTYVSMDTYHRKNHGVPVQEPKEVYTKTSWNKRLPFASFNKPNGCSGYSTVTIAYGKDAGSCAPQYVEQPCPK